MEMFLSPCKMSSASAPGAITLAYSKTNASPTGLKGVILKCLKIFVCFRGFFNMKYFTLLTSQYYPDRIFCLEHVFYPSFQDWSMPL